MRKRSNREEGDQLQAEDDASAPAVKRALRNVVKGCGGRFVRAPTKHKKTRQTLTDTDIELQNSRTVIEDMTKETEKAMKIVEDYKYRLKLRANERTEKK
jgi:hypothetical protein